MSSESDGVELSNDDKRTLKELLADYRDSSITRRAAMGGAAALMGGAAFGAGRVTAQPTGDEGQVGQQGDRVEAWVSEMDALEVDTGQINGVVSLDNNDANKDDVDTYLNNDLSGGDVVVVESGGHEVSEITTTDGFVLILKGAIRPDGDHPIWNHNGGSREVVLVNRGGRFGADTISTGSYTSNLLNIHGRLRTIGTIEVKGHGSIVVNFEQDDGDANLNHTWVSLLVDGEAPDGSRGSSDNVVIRNTSGNAPNVNGMYVELVNSRRSAGHGFRTEAGAGNAYFAGVGDNDRGILLNSGSDIYAWVRSDGSNANTDVFNIGASNLTLFGSPNGAPSGPVLRRGNQFRSTNNGGDIEAAEFMNLSAANSSESVSVPFTGLNDTQLGKLEALGDQVFNIYSGTSRALSLDGQSVGIQKLDTSDGYSWQDVTASRSFGSQETAPSDRDIEVSVVIQAGSASTRQIVDLDIGGSPRGRIRWESGANDANDMQILYGRVPAGSSYQVVQDDGTASAINQWAELR